MKRYLLRLKSYFSLTIILIILSSTLNIALSLVLKLIIDTAENKDQSQLYRAIGFAILYLAVFFIIGYLKRFSQHSFIRTVTINVRYDVFSKILNKKVEDFTSQNSAQYMSVLTNDINIIEQDYFINILDIISSIYSFLLATILLIKINFFIAIGVFIISFVTIALPQIFSKELMKRKKIYSDILGNFTAKIKDIFTGFEVIKSFNIEDKVISEYKNLNKDTEILKYKFNILSSLSEITSFSFGMLMYFTTISIGAYFTIKGTLTIGTMIAATQLMNNIVNPIVDISSRISRLKSIKPIENKILNIIKESSEENRGISKELFSDSIEFRNVGFCYYKGKLALDNVSLTINKGHKYAIVGNSGSGKSTILKLLLGYFDEYNGEIYIDGINHRKIRREDLYKLISLIHQNIFLFDASIKDNITLYNNYDIESLNRAIKLAGLQSFADSLERGIDTFVGENGGNLSGGEKQRIAIARTVIKNTPIVILDEATSALDNQTSYYIEKSILDIEGLTAIIVTHKLSEDLLRKYDNIIALKDGNIVEQGKFDDLMESKGYFYSLYNVQ